MAEPETPATAQLTPRRRPDAPRQLARRIGEWLRGPAGRATPATIRPVEDEAELHRLQVTSRTVAPWPIIAAAGAAMIAVLRRRRRKPKA